MGILREVNEAYIRSKVFPNFENKALQKDKFKKKKTISACFSF